MTFEELVEKLKGREIISWSGARKNSKEVIFYLDQEESIVFGHDQHCCESVNLVDFEKQGKMEGELLYIQESSNKDNPPNDWGSHTWTFYDVRTTKGLLTMRWLGTSNGYYSESVDVTFGKVNADRYNREYITMY